MYEVEKDTSCRKILHQLYPQTCVFTDIFEMVTNDPRSNELIDPKDIVWNKRCYCETHDQMCRVRFPPDSLLVLGAPCVLFSTILDGRRLDSEKHVVGRKNTHLCIANAGNVRFGKREKFNNIAKAQVHSVGTAAIQRCLSSVHENVEGYDEVSS